MAGTLIPIPANEWTLIKADFKQGRLSPTLTNPTRYYYDAVPLNGTPPAFELRSGIVLSGEFEIRYRDAIDLYVYALDYAGIVDFDDDPIFTDVFVQDQTTSPVEYFLTEILNDVVITATAAAKTKTLQLQAGHGFIVRDFIEIYAETPISGVILKRFVQLRVLAVVSNTITVQPFIGFDLDPVNIIFSRRSNGDMTVDGSVTPVRFRIGPPNGIVWDLTRTMVIMVVLTNPDDALYGDLPTLTNGVFFGVETDLGEEYLVNILANAGYRATAYDVTYTTRSSGGGDFGVSVRKSFAGREHYGVAIRLEGPTNDEFVAYINDDLTGLTEHAQKVMGHITI